MIRLGLVGCGKWGVNYVRAALDTGIARVDAVYRMSTSPSAGFVYWMRTLDEMLCAPLGAIVVASPPEGRVELCERILERRFPIIVEKPLALSVEEAERISLAAREAGVPWLVAHQHLFSAAYEEIRGEVLGMNDLAVLSHSGGPGPARSYSALWDYGPHDVAMILGLIGEDASLKGAIAAGPETFELVLGAGLHYAAARVSSEAARKHRSFEVSTSDGRVLQYDDARPPGEKLLVDGKPKMVSREPPLTRMLRGFAEAVRTGRTDWRFGDFGVKVVRVLEAADGWIKEGRRDVDDQDEDLRRVVG